MCRNMLKFFVLILVTLLFISYAYSQYEFDSLPMLKIKKSRKNPSKKFITMKEYACPVEPLKDINTATSSEKNDNSKPKYCLFSRPVIDKTKTKCEAEVKPIVLPSKKNRELVKCGLLDTQLLYSVGFYHCGNVNNLKEFHEREAQNDWENYTGIRQILEVYEICYDTAINETIWTRHRIQTAFLFDKLKRTNGKYSEIEISTDPFLLRGPPFERIKKMYETESQKDESQDQSKMQPQLLVPAEHFAFEIWKKTTNHVINTFPLWTKLAPLMSAINAGLKRAQMNLYMSDPGSFSRLEFKTRVKRLGLLPNKPEDRLSPEQFLQPNIWYILVYEKTNMTGLLINIHNTPGKPPLVKNCSNPEVCEFQQWTKDEQVKSAISESELEYAYCCPVQPQQVKDIFFEDTKINGVLGLNDLLIGGLKRKERDSSKSNIKLFGQNIGESSASNAESMQIEPSSRGAEPMQIT